MLSVNGLAGKLRMRYIYLDKSILTQLYTHSTEETGIVIVVDLTTGSCFMGNTQGGNHTVTEMMDSGGTFQAGVNVGTASDQIMSVGWSTSTSKYYIWNGYGVAHNVLIISFTPN